ncbi:alpha/beta hydrolase [Halomonas saccharevitans]|uniref:Alpha/beta hydrolase n=1 Tax=Halomonas saccharevitans TaxID=416872 RepID=A0ABU3NHW7_9GAMM|nr:alpha/beta hydrolase [Halomonas saccharevitans]MDT8879761.1 alpha/beta hydrolase [Halomonas saccharevitans]
MSVRHLATREEIDRAYDPMRGRDGEALIADWRSRSARSRERLRLIPDVAYGPTLAERMDVFPGSEPGGPVHLFLHGGYWRALSHDEFGFVADGLVAAGISVAVVNYALCPEVRFGEIVRQSRAAVAWMHRHGASLGVDPGRLSVSGHSAGGHLCAMLLATRWEEEYGLPRDLIRGALSISGLYDLAPFPRSWLQPKLRLTDRDVIDYSPVRQPCRSPARVKLVAGGEEPEAFAGQMAAQAAHLRGQGCAVDSALLPGDDHFSILDHYRPGGRFVDEIVAFHR